MLGVSTAMAITITDEEVIAEEMNVAGGCAYGYQEISFIEAGDTEIDISVVKGETSRQSIAIAFGTGGMDESTIVEYVDQNSLR